MQVEPDELATRPAAWETLWDYLADEIGVTRAALAATGFTLHHTTPRPRPYHRGSDVLVQAVWRPGSLTIAASPGATGLARAWLHHADGADAVMSPSSVGWLREQAARGGARLLELRQYALFADRLLARLDPAVRSLDQRDAAQLTEQLGWTADEAAAWISRGVVGGFAGDQLVCRVCPYRLSPHVAEVGVETLPEFRSQGWARRTVHAAASALLDDCDVVLYTANPSNLASCRVAEALHAELACEMVVLLAPADDDQPPACARAGDLLED